MKRTFYFQRGTAPVDWDAADTLVMANPEWLRRNEREFAAVERLLPALGSHVWVATSGTSSHAPGRMRWVALSKAAFLASAAAVNAHLSATAADVWAHALPIFHVGGLGVLARCWLNGAVVVPAIEDRWDARRFHAAVSESGATLTALVPSQVHDLVAAGLPSPPSLRAIVVGGARLDPALYRAARALGWPCLPSYGLTETCSQVATASLESIRDEEMPAAIPVLGHAEIRATAAGRLSVRAASLLTCVAEWDGAGIRVDDPKRDGWFETEDLGRVSGGRVEVFGRATESVKVLGELVSLPHVEERARRWVESEPHRRDAVTDLAVVALPDARLGHELVLVLARATPCLATQELQNAAIPDLTPVERIRRVQWVAEIPRTALGKCRRALLTRQVSEASGRATASPGSG